MYGFTNIVVQQTLKTAPNIMEQNLFLVILSAKDNLSRTQYQTVNKNLIVASKFPSKERKCKLCTIQTNQLWPLSIYWSVNPWIVASNGRPKCFSCHILSFVMFGLHWPLWCISIVWKVYFNYFSIFRNLLNSYRMLIY